MKISVRFINSEKRYAYECPYPVRVLDTVMVPGSWYSDGEEREALVVAIGDEPASDYKGPLKQVLHVIPWEGNR